MNFVLIKTLKLDEFGDNWKDCYIKVKEPSVKQMQELSKGPEDAKNVTETGIESVKNIVKECFIDGRGFNGKEKVKIKKDEVDKLPYSIYKKCLDFLVSGQQEQLRNTKE